jgi:hypothetical protein
MENYVVLAMLHFTSMQTSPDAPLEINESRPYEEVENHSSAQIENSN